MTCSSSKSRLSYSSSSDESRLSYSISSSSGSISIKTSATVRNEILNNCMYSNRERVISATAPINNQPHSIKSNEFISEKEASGDSEINKVASIYSVAEHSIDSDVAIRNDALNLFVALQKKRGVPEEQTSKIVSELQ